MKIYYGVRFFSDNQTTIGEPNKMTGQYNIACEIVAFSSKENLNEWIYKEKRTAPCGLGGGVRDEVKKSQLRALCFGMTVKDFNEYIDDLVVDS